MFLTITTVVVAWLCAEVYVQLSDPVSDEESYRPTRHG